MLNKKIMFIAILLISLLSISAVNAADDAAIDENVLEESISDADLGDIQDDELGQGDGNVLSDDGDPTPPPATPSFYLLSDKIVNGGDEVNLTEDYVYQPMTESHFQKGINITRNLTINGNGHSIDGKNQARIFYVYPDCNVTFKDIVFINGNATDEDDVGGAIFGNIQGTTLAINCSFINNTATSGGAFVWGNATNCTFLQNSAVESGGAVGVVFAINCNFLENSAGEYGGAFIVGYATNCTFKNNKAKCGGALGIVNATNCSFSQNTAGEYGGAILESYAENCTFNSNSAYSGGAMVNSTASNSIFTENTASIGGAMLNSTASNCTFTMNIASSEGGAISNSNASNCTFTQNVASWSGGAIYQGNAINCTFIKNTASEGGAMRSGNATDCNFTENSAIGEDYACGGAMDYSNAINCTFIKNTAPYGGAMFDGIANNCRFIENNAKFWGGAMYASSVNNSNFIQNSAKYAGALAEGDATNCTFILNHAEIGNDAVGAITKDCKFIIPTFIASDLKTAYNSGEKFKFTLKADEQVLDGVNTIISIYKGSTFVANYSALSGEGWTVNLPAGTYKAVLSIAGSDVEPVTKTITVAKNPTAITASAVTATYNVNKYLTIKLTDANGKALSGVKVTVTLGTAKTYTTDKYGQIKINVAKLVPKTYTAKIAYAGNANYLASSKDVKVVVKKASPKMTAKAKSFKVTVKTKKYTITLKNNKGKVMKKAKLTLKVGKKTYKATTNSKGKATFKITKLTKKGKYTAVIKYAGNKYYKALSKKAKITVK